MLKIVRSSGSPLAGARIFERRQEAMKSRAIQFKCSACNHTGEIQIPWDVDAPGRQDIIRKVLDEHRRIGCTVRDAAARRSYEISYPRG